MVIQRRSVGTCIVLCIVTCGIYTLFWLYGMARDVCTVKGVQSDAGTVILLSIVTCGIYGIYWIYKSSKELYYAEQDLGLRTSDNSVVNLILSIFGLVIVAYAIIQSSLNGISDATYHS